MYEPVACQNGEKRPGGILYAECERADFLVRRLPLACLKAAAQAKGGSDVTEVPFEDTTLLAMATRMLAKIL
jgi:hypothetical protein